MSGPGALLGRSCVALTAALLGSTLLAGCPDDPPGAPPDRDAGGGGPDANDPFLDSDGDGLCNDTEHTRGTDPFAPDTDADGYSDWVEVVFGFDALLPASPDREAVFTLTESEAAETIVPVVVLVRGRGEDYSGALEALDGRDPLGITARDFHTGSVALYANPPENVAAVEPEAERFRIVVGLTELHYEARFAFGDNLVRRCLRAYPFRYAIKRSDGRIVSSLRKLLVIVPEGGSVARSEWCAPDPPCR